MTEYVFDIALDRRFTESPPAGAVDVTAADTLLIHNSETGMVMRIPFSALSTALSSALSGAYAPLVDGKVPAANLPAYVDDVLEYANLSSFPATGETGKIYVALDTNLTYRWSGSAYVEISQSLALGETSATAYRGDRGKTAYDHSQTSGNPHGTSKADVGLGNVDNTSDANKPVSTAQATALAGKQDNLNGLFQSNGGVYADAPDWTWVTLMTFPSVNMGTWIVNVALWANSASTWSGTYLVNMQANTSVVTALRTSSGNLSVQMSGRNLQARQGVGVAFSITWAVTRLS